MRGNLHVRCGAGEKVEITSKPYLSLFMLEPKNAAQNAEYIGYATPNNQAKALLPKEIKEDKAFYPDEQTIKKLEVYNNLGNHWLGIYNDLYLQFKMYRK